MDLLAKFERALEDLVEGVFSRAFRAQLQPVEVAKRLTREMESARTVSVSTTYVPNLYVVALAPDTFAAFQPISGRLLGELEQYLREFAGERDYATVGPIAVRLQEDASLKSGDIGLQAISDPAAQPSASPTPSVLRSYGASTAKQAGAGTDGTVVLPTTPASALEVIAGEGVGRRIPLADALTIGRGPDNGITIADPGVSRHHADIILEEGGNWVLRDRGSTNGTIVNGRRITEHPLHPGDIVQIGKAGFQVK